MICASFSRLNGESTTSVTAVTVSGRIGEGKERQAEYVALEVEAQDLPAAIAEHAARMQPAGADDEQLARALILANDDGAAPIGALLLLEPGERRLSRFGQPDIVAEPLSEATSQGRIYPQRL